MKERLSPSRRQPFFGFFASIVDPPHTVTIVVDEVIILAAGRECGRLYYVTISRNDAKQEIDNFDVSQAGWSDAIYDLQEPAHSQITSSP